MLQEIQVGSGGGEGVNLVTGEFTSSVNQVTVDVGFKPRILMVTCRNSSNSIAILYYYNADIDTAKYIVASSDNSLKNPSFPDTAAYRLRNITDNGFVVNGFTGSTWRGNCTYIAIE